MKQCIKYFMIILLGVLLYDGAAQAAGISCTLISNDSERCFLSQAPTSHQQNIRNIYNHFSSMPLYMDNVDSTQVPGNKSFFILLNYFRMYWWPIRRVAIRCCIPLSILCPIRSPIMYSG